MKRSELYELEALIHLVGIVFLIVVLLDDNINNWWSLLGILLILFEFK